MIGTGFTDIAAAEATALYLERLAASPREQGLTRTARSHPFQRWFGPTLLSHHRSPQSDLLPLLVWRGTVPGKAPNWW